MATTKKYVSLDKLSLYDEKIKAKIAADDAATLKSAKDYADSLADNYDAAGAAATVQGKLDEEVLRAKAAEEVNAAAAKQAQDEVDALELVVATKAAQADLEALAGKVGEVPVDQTVMDIITNIQENAYDDTAIRGLISDLDAAKADKTQVAIDIAAAVEVEEEARIAAVAAVQGEVDTLKQTHTTDKAALEAAIALKADQTALDDVSAVANAAVKQSDYDTKVAALEAEDDRIEGLVTAEAAKAREEEGKLDERLVEVEAFFKLAEGESLDTALDTLVEIQTYLDGEGAVADQMLLDIAANAKAIEDHVAIDHDFAAADEVLASALNAEIAKKADATVVEGINGRLTTAEGKVSTLESQMTAVQGAVATKVEQEAYNAKVEALEGKDTELAGKIEALEAKFGEGEGSVEDMISDAVADEASRVDGLLANKVDKVEGKGLSTNDLTNELKANYDAAYAHSQVAHAPADAQANVIESVKVNGAALTITDKAVDITMPTKVSDLTNDAGYLVASDIANKADKATTLAGYGITDAYTKTETDTAIANAVGQFVECSEEDINALFN